MKTENKYAFISYQRGDWFPAMMLSLRMSCFHLPHGLSNDFRKKSHRLIPVYRDRENLTSGENKDKILEEVETARYLIVFCTKNSVEKTTWVNDEVGHFLKTHDLDHVIPYIPPAKENDGVYYVPALKQAIKEKEQQDPNYFFLYVSHQQEELELGLLHRLFPFVFRYEKSYIRVIAKTLGDYPFDSLWNSHKKFLRRVLRAIIFAILTFLFIVLYFGCTISAPLRISDAEPNQNLPKARNIVLKVDNAEYPLKSLDTTIMLTDIPGKYRFRDIPVTLSAIYYKPLSTSLNMGKGFGNQYELIVERDSTFAVYHGIVTDKDGIPVEKAEVTVGNKRATTDHNGEFRIVFDIGDQSETKHLHIEKGGIGLNDNESESPDSSRFILK